MRYSPEQKAASRDALVRAAARVIREKGFQGVGVDELSQAAGVTSGSFYKHFGSKTEVLLEVARAGIDRVATQIRRLRSSPTVDATGGWVSDLATLHTSRDHILSAGLGCNLAALTADVARSVPEVRKAYDDSIRNAVDAMAEAEPLSDGVEGRARALAMLALLSGGATMARAVLDPSLSAEISEAVRRATLLLAMGELPATPRSDVAWNPADY
jgi:TetR/AcrR family transcriptional regulator, transcriptional repressor for nem operon